MRARVKMSQTLPSVLLLSDKSSVTSLDKANLLNECFGSKFSVPSNSECPFPFCKDLGLDAFSQIAVSVDQVASLLLTLDRAKACGSDNLSGYILRERAVAGMSYQNQCMLPRDCIHCIARAALLLSNFIRQMRSNFEFDDGFMVKSVFFS